ncbi:hypothetical protein [Sanguibacter sp. Leaf3]|uniref:hypothetical protein n=1 Tax=Sanguibacter sp. Leaf3 TaxID=1736209 RepID=UPI0006FBFE13|nr:hypothetical protein [Sanguibacter sp. Leaf3]KQU00290.1 hypothetical protein ASG53_05435 [Sanguibacter sp. Leaf3]
MGTKTTTAPGAAPARAPERARAGTSPTGTPSTGLAGLVRARLRASRAALLGLTAVTLLVAGTVGGTFAFVEQSSTQAVRTAPDLLTGPGAVLRVTTRLAPDPAAQDGTVRQIFASATGETPVDVSRSLTTEARSASAADGTPLEQVVLSARTAAAGSTVPGPGEALLPTSAAEPLGLEVGDTVVVADVPLVVVGLWEPGPGVPGSALDETSGSGEPPYGPVLVDEQTLLAVQDDPFVGWTLSTRTPLLTVDDVATLAAGLPGVRGAVTAGSADVRGVVETGTLTATVAALDAQASTARAVTTAPVVLLLVVSLVSLVELARMLVAVRARESQILVARGASAAQLGRLGLVEVLPAAVGGALLGGAGAWAALALVGPVGGWTTLGAAWIVGSAAGVAALVAVVFVVVTAVDARSLARVRAVDASGRARTAVGVVAVVLLGAVSVLLGWRLWRARGLAVPEAEALVVAAPGVLLLALVLVVLVLLAPTLRLVERRARRRPGLAPVYAARQVSRRLVAFTVPAVLVALATGSVLLASGYSGTVDHLRGQVGGLATGSDVRVQTTTTGVVTPLTTVPALDVDAGVAAASSLVLDVEGTVGDGPVRVLAVPGEQIAPLLSRTPAVDASSLVVVAPRPALPGLALPEGTSALRLDLAGQAVEAEIDETRFSGRIRAPMPAFGGPPVPVTTVVWLADEHGGIVQTSADPVSFPVLAGDDGARTDVEVEIAVPDTTSRWRVVSIELRADPRRGPVALDLAVTSVGTLAASGDAADDGTSEPTDLAGAKGTWSLLDALVGASGTGYDGSLSLTSPPDAVLPAVSGVLEAAAVQVRLRFMPPGADPSLDPGATDLAPAVPAVVVPELLARLDAAVGDTLDATVVGQRVTLEIVGSVPALPGGLGGPALMLDLDALQAFGLRTARAPAAADEIWVAAQDPSEVGVLVEAVETQVPPAWTVTSAGTAAAVPAPSIGSAFWIAAAGAVALSLAGTWSVLGALGRARRGEVVALRAVGVSGGAQARSRTSELLIVLGCAVVAGLVSGALVTLAVAGLFARVTVPEAFAGIASGVHPSVVPMVVLLLALVVGAGLLVADQARTVRRQALDLDHREDAR